MTELRTDPLTGRAVFFATGRAARPNEFAPSDKNAEPTPTNVVACPFCAGNERLTTFPLEERRDEAGRWTQRVLRNKYPVCGDDDPGGCPGAHEVIVESRDHVTRTGQLTSADLANVFSLYASRLRCWRRAPDSRSLAVFKNVGPSAGASLSHLHSQVVAFSSVTVQQQVEAGNLARAQDPAHAWRRWQEAELSCGRRLVAETPGWVVLCPTVSRAAGEFWVMPRTPAPLFEQALADEAACAAMSALLLPLLTRLERLIKPHGYNLMVHTAPSRCDLSDAFCWRVEVTPRVATLAGFELTTGMYINTKPPEQAAEELRG